ncbi:MAG: ATPase [Petrotogaceae bacterium]|jgi:energy-coupling factor transporter ATP-binding protein EcfA2|nr:ATPase [Petrotogaceae bacterium]
MRSVIINGEVSYSAIAQIINSNVFEQILSELISDSQERKNSLHSFFELFLKNTDEVDPVKKYDISAIIQLLLALTINPIEKIDGSPYYNFPKMGNRKDQLVKFIEGLFNLWRNKHRFMYKTDKYTSESFDRIFKQMLLVNTNSDLKNIVQSMYRQILINISDNRLKILRQVPSSAQVGFMIDKPEIKENSKIKNARWLYDMNFIWSIVFEPPVIFYTRSNTRKGLFKVYDQPVLDSIGLENIEDWFVFPIHVASKFFLVVVNKEYLCHAAGLGNLFELASFNTIENQKPDAIYIYGMGKDFFKEKDDVNGVIYREKDGMYVGIVGDDPSVDYFGYMKKMILTLHNLIVIDEGRLPVHGAFAEIKLRDGKKANIMLMGDSGAGKSETLDALNRLRDEVSEVNILIDDMGSFDIDEDGTVVAYGTETGAFVRLDDLQPGYAYSAMDRSIFMNPNEVNARVIVPYSNYGDIIKPTKVDYFFYANNYDRIEDSNAIHFFNETDMAVEVFSKGARMAKGTTSEKGLSYSYFANPFGAIQRKEKHNEIAKKYMKHMIENNVRIGELKTQLGIDGFEQQGPMIAAKALLKLIEETEK